MKWKYFDLTDTHDQEKFYTDGSDNSFLSVGKMEILDKSVIKYDKTKQTAITVSSLGTNQAIAIGAYNFALDKIDYS